MGAAICVVLLIATGCGATPTPRPTETPVSIPTASPRPSGPPPALITKIGAPESALDLIVRPGNAERGANDAAYDWVTPFEKDTGCKVNAFETGTSEQLIEKVQAAPPGTYDGALVAGDVGVQLIVERRVQPIDVENLFPAWEDIWTPLQSPAHNTVDGVHYGLSQGWAANLLLWNSTAVQPDPTSWAPVYESTPALKGRVTAYDSALSIADAAVFLSQAEPGLGIVDPYELTRAQFDAAVALLTAQRPLIGGYWGTPLDEIGAFADGDAVIGPGWPAQLHLLQAQDPPVPVKGTLPLEGATGYADTWMLLASAKHPNCMLRWMAWTISPEVQKITAEFVGEAPANLAACGSLDDHHGALGFPGFCTFHHAADDSFAGLVQFWKTPLADCGDERGQACVAYPEWVQQWDEIKAAG